MNAIKEKRLALGLTQSALARALGVCLTCVTNWEQGRSKPSADKSYQLCTFFQCEPEDLGLAPKVPKIPTRAKEYIDRMRELGLTSRQLEKKAGVSKNVIWGMKTGKHWPLWSTRQKLRQALGMPEERAFTPEERNERFLEMQDSIQWIVRKYASRIRAVHMDPEDA